MLRNHNNNKQKKTKKTLQENDGLIFPAECWCLIYNSLLGHSTEFSYILKFFFSSHTDKLENESILFINDDNFLFVHMHVVCCMCDMCESWIISTSICFSNLYYFYLFYCRYANDIKFCFHYIGTSFLNSFVYAMIWQIKFFSLETCDAKKKKKELKRSYNCIISFIITINYILVCVYIKCTKWIENEQNNPKYVVRAKS